EADGMGETSGVEVNAHHVSSRNILIFVEGVSIPESSGQRVLEVVVSVESPGVMRETVVYFPQKFVVAERHADTPVEHVKRSRKQDRGKRILLGALTVHEEEQLVLDDGSA